MRPTLSALAICSLVVLPGSMAVAQDKIAPTRTYGNERNYGAGFGATYTNKSRLAPDRDFGLPAAARPKAMPEQGNELVKGAPAPSHPITNDAASATPNDSSRVTPDSFGLAPLAPNHDLIPPASTSGSTDFFARTTDFGALKSDDDADATETPLYTTQVPGAATGDAAQPQQGTAGPGASSSDAFGSNAFGTKQTTARGE